MYIDKMYIEKITITHYTTLQHTATHSISCGLRDSIDVFPGRATQCNTVQKAATHCNILQHTATHCNKLQSATNCTSCGFGGYIDLFPSSPLVLSPTYTITQTATHCNTLQHTAPPADLGAP